MKQNNDPAATSARVGGARHAHGRGRHDQGRANAAWRAAVAARYGGDVEVEWDNGSCVVDGDRYEVITPPQSEEASQTAD